jgi:hypothetical protein
MATDPEHPTQSRRSKYRYIFYGKHHGGGSAGDAKWADDVTRGEEFSVFDQADFFDISDDRGHLFGVLRDNKGELRDLGTWQQQVAEFPKAADSCPWHGYPIWAVNALAPSNRVDQKMRPAKDVFQKMERASLITKQQRKRLMKGDHA